MTAEEVRKKLRKVAQPQKAWAEAHGINQGVLSDIINGRRDLTETGTSSKILDALGLERVVSFRPARTSKER